MEKESAFKNWINQTVVNKTAESFQSIYPKFNVKRFQKISGKLKDHELKGRVLLITAGLKVELPADFATAAKMLKKVLAQHKLTGFELWPISEYISQFGLDNTDESLDLMYLLTQQFTAEFAIRPFLQKDPERILKKLRQWLKDDNVHVRRWISEGTRPILPWGGKIPSFIKLPATWDLLEALKYDEELYVRKSVANHLNDISKDHPLLVVDVLKKWEASAPKQHLDKIHWIKKHALRTLIKKGHPKALALMGVASKTDVRLTKFMMSKKSYKVGETLEFSFEIESTAKRSQKLIVDYGIGFRKANGSISTKVFKLKSIDLAATQKQVISKRHSLKVIMTTKFYGGAHELIVQVNGVILKKVTWDFII